MSKVEMFLITILLCINQILTLKMQIVVALPFLKLEQVTLNSQTSSWAYWNRLIFIFLFTCSDWLEKYYIVSAISLNFCISVGQLSQVGRQFYNTDIEVEILSKEETEKMTYVVRKQSKIFLNKLAKDVL